MNDPNQSEQSDSTGGGVTGEARDPVAAGPGSSPSPLDAAAPVEPLPTDPPPAGADGPSSPPPESGQERSAADEKDAGGPAVVPDEAAPVDAPSSVEAPSSTAPEDRPVEEAEGDDAKPARDRSAPAAAKSPGAERRARNKFYAFTTPISPVLPCGEWTEFRRFVAADIDARQQRARGKECLLPIGVSYWSEEVARAAVEQDCDPLLVGDRDLERLRSGLSLLGVSVHPPEFVLDHDPAYYRWTQWIFLQLYRRGLVKLASPGVTGQLEGPEEPENGAFTDDSGMESEHEKLWMLRLSQYGERLINDLGKSNWWAQEKANQRHRLGRLRGCDLLLQVGHYLRGEVDELKVFSPRVETIYGATFVLVHPWHPILAAVVEESYEEDVRFYRDRVLRNQEPRLSGARTGGFAINPATLQRIPVLVSRLAMDPECGGTILGVPAHDSVLYELARRVRLPIREVVRGNGVRRDGRGNLQEPYLGEGTLTNSGPFSGTTTRAARDRIINFLGRRGICRRSTRFYFDWLPASRRSIWGVPVPVIHCPACGPRPVPEHELPVRPPRVGPEQLRAAGFGEGGSSGDQTPDLSFFESFAPVSCPECRGRARRDTQVLPAWLGKSWMLLRHAIPELAGDVEGWRPVSAEDAGESRDRAEAAGEPAPEAEARSVQNLSLEEIDQLALFDEGSGEPEDSGEEGAAGEEGAPVGGGGDSPGEAVGGAAGAVGDEAVRTTPDDAPAANLRVEDLASSGHAAGGAGPAADSGPGGEAGDSAPPSSPARSDPEANHDEPAAAPGEPAPEEATGTESEAGSGPDSPREGTARVQPFRRAGARKWLSVDLGLGTSAGGVLEVLWSRFVTKFLYDLREIAFYEPFYRFARVGDVSAWEASGGRPAADGTRGADGEEGAAQTASLPPVETLVEKYGSDAVRMGVVSRCGISSPMALSEGELVGIRRLLGRIRRNVSMRLERGKFVSRRVLVEKHRLIRRVTDGIRGLRFHKAIAGIHTFVNFLHDPDLRDEEMDRGSIQMFLVVLWPFAPGLAEELWAIAGAPEPIEKQGWPEASGELLQSEEIELPVQIDDRIVLRMRATPDLDARALRELALGDERIREILAERHVDRVIAVPGRVVNLLVTSPS